MKYKFSSRKKLLQMIVFGFVFPIFYLNCTKEHPTQIDVNSVDHIVMGKYGISNDTNKYMPRKLSKDDVRLFVSQWNDLTDGESCIYDTQYLIIIYFKNGSKNRSFRINGKTIKETTDCCYDFSDGQYFDKLWAKSTVDSSAFSK